MQPFADADGPEETATGLQAWEPADYRLEALRLAVGLYIGRDCSGPIVVHAASEFYRWLTRAVSLTLNDPVITVQGSSPARVIPVKRTGANMAVTMTDGDQAAYTVSETDSKGFPVTGDMITWTESSGGTVVTTDGTSGVFVAVAPGTVTVTATDGVLTASDTINVTAGGAAALVLGTATVTPQAAAAPTA